MSIRLNETGNPKAIPSNIYTVSSYAVDVGKVQRITGASVEYNSCAYWNNRKKYIPKRGSLIVYSDARKDADGNNIPRMKVADGTTYLIDLPFIDNEDELIQHINDKSIHVTPEEKEMWGSGVTLSADDKDELLIVTKVNS